jgi:diaminohydroxyphosphoribosylaminopyrimidine deaminase/5-amino-6-(5-phosphoribosylamino)uracil reductase
MTQQWRDVPRLVRAGETLPDRWEGLFGPLRAPCTERPMVIGQIGQSLDGRIATASGHSDYINGREGIAHLHRLRALVDAVVVGAGTVRADDPQLTVRHVEGPCPVRVVIDPRGTLPATARAFASDGVQRIVITRQPPCASLPTGIETIALPDSDGRIAPRAILDALFERGLRRVLIEGGAHTVSAFLSAGCLDRLHVMVAPLILGSGIAGIDLPPVADMTGALRVAMRVHALGSDVLFDCDLSGAGEAHKQFAELHTGLRPGR